MDIIEAIRKACIEEQEIWQTDAPVTDGTEDICEGRAEFAGQILRLIKRLDTTPDGYTKGPGPLDGSGKLTMKEMPSAVQLQWTGTHAYKPKTLQQKAIEASVRRSEINTSDWTPDA
jgi:hypothetical protein